METLFIRLIQNDSIVEFICLDENQAVIQTPQIADINHLSSPASNRTVIFISPGMEILSIEKTLPKMPKNKLLTAVPFAIEEQLLDTPDSYHYVIADIDNNGQTQILAAKQEIIQHWLDEFKAQQIYCTVMLPDYLLIPYEKNIWTVFLEKNALVRFGYYQGFSCDIAFLPDMLAFTLQQCAEEVRPHTIKIYNTSTELPWPETRLTSLGIPLEILPSQESLIIIMAKNFSADLLSANLLQDKFTQNQHLDKAKKLWLIAAGVAVGALVISFISSIIEFSILKHRDNVLQEKIAVIYQQVYPNATSVVSPQLRMERTLKDLQSNQVGGGYLGLLAMTGSVLQKNHDIHLSGLRYQEGKLVVDITASSFSMLNKLIKQWSQAGMQVHQDQASTQENGKVTARFTLQGNNK